MYMYNGVQQPPYVEKKKWIIIPHTVLYIYIYMFFLWNQMYINAEKSYTLLGTTIW